MARRDAVESWVELLASFCQDDTITESNWKLLVSLLHDDNDISVSKESAYERYVTLTEKMIQERKEPIAQRITIIDGDKRFLFPCKLICAVAFVVAWNANWSIALLARISLALFVPEERAVVLFAKPKRGLVKAPLAAIAVFLSHKENLWHTELVEKLGNQVVEFYDSDDNCELRVNVAQAALALTNMNHRDWREKPLLMIGISPLLFLQPWQAYGKTRTFKDSITESFAQLVQVFESEAYCGLLSYLKALHSFVELLVPHLLIEGAMLAPHPAASSEWFTTFSSSIGSQVAGTLHTLFETEKSKKEAALENELLEVKKTLADQRQRIVDERSTWEAERASMSKIQQEVKEMVELDVGGTRFKTSRTTLTKQSGSFFSAYFSGRYTLSTTADGAVFIDRSPQHFGMVLNWLRDGHVPLPTAKQPCLELLQEAKYYALKWLEDCIHHHLQTL